MAKFGPPDPSNPGKIMGLDAKIFLEKWRAVSNVRMNSTSGMSRSLLNIEKRSLPRLMLSGVGLASKDAV